MEPRPSPAPAPARAPPRDFGDQAGNKDAYDAHDHSAARAGRASKASSKSRARDSVISHPTSPRVATPSPPSPVSSLSSAPSQPGAHHAHPSHHAIEPVPPPAPVRLDPEKADGSPHRSPSPTRSARQPPSNPDIATQTVVYDSADYHEKGPEDKPIQLLLYLSLPCALLSLLIMLWTLVALLISLFLQPFRLFSPRSTLPAQLTTLLAPPLNLQLHLVYSFSSSVSYSAPMLVTIHLLSPFVAVGVAIAAWTAACFWSFSAIIGDPAGQDGRNDGKESILGVRNWWHRWLSRALR